MFQDAHDVGSTSMTIKYRQGGPNRRRRKEEFDEPPPRFDTDLVGFEEPLFLPGGLPRALEDAGRNREHPMRGMSWNLRKGFTINPGDWVLHWSNMYGARWLLVYATNLEDLIVVCREGGYLKMTRPDARLLLREKAEVPPWWEEWAEAYMASLPAN